MRKIEGLGQRHRSGWMAEACGCRAEKAWRAWADLKCGSRATAVPPSALRQYWVQLRATTPAPRPTPPPPPPLHLAPSPHPNLPHPETQPLPRASHSSIPAAPILSPQPGPCLAVLAALAGPSGPKPSTRQTVTDVHCWNGQGAGALGVLLMGLGTKCVLRKYLFNGIQMKQGEVGNQRDREMVSQRDRKPETKG